ncbi:MAG TPA: BBP7 family outer membrane beta-barrel protein [Gemmataceae bacterium]|nr:BBP7 family outer membrane beta-barrel protein [Gemmataceae bacterium]
MKRGYLAAVLVVLAAATSAWADEEPDGSMRTWLDADYLLWWLKPAPTGPALLTTGNLTNPTSLGSGILGESGTSILAGNSNFNQGPYSGFRIGGGVMNCAGTIGAEGSFFYLSQRGVGDTFSSDDSGNPLLARPIIDARTGNETVLFVSAPNAFNGSFNAESSTEFFGADANVLLPWARCAACYPDEVGYYVTGLGGFLYLNLSDDLTLSQSSNVLANGVGFFDSVPISPGGNISLSDDIRTLNQFYGGQIGVKAGVNWWRLSLNGVAKLGLGSMREEANLSGSTTVTNGPLGTSATVPGGLYVLGTNAGNYSRNILAVAPQGGLNFGFEITSQIKLTVGYTMIYVSDVARPGNLIDRTVDRTALPSSQTFSTSVPGAVRPSFTWSGTDFWAQGINVGLSLRF